MKRREFLGLGVTLTAIAAGGRGLLPDIAGAAGAAEAKITDKDILKEGQPAPIANYCEHPEKQPNKFCPDWKSKPGNCKECTFFNMDNSMTTYKGGKYAHCQLLTDPKKARFVSEGAWCATFVKKS